MLAHNGEINTVAGNVNWMKSHETRLAADGLNEFLESVKPVVQAGGSDTASLDNVFELLVRAGRDAPMAKALMIPPSLGNDANDAEEASGYVPVLQFGDGALGRAGGGPRPRMDVSSSPGWTAMACGRCAIPSPRIRCWWSAPRPAW